jgi:hypothetical protein
MKPLQWDAAGLTNARRSEMNYCQGMGRQTKAVPGKPRDDNEEPRRGKGRRFTERSHLTEMGRDPIAAHAGVGGEYNAVGRAPSPRRERPSIESGGGGGGGGFSLDERSPMDGPESPGATVLRSIIDASSPEGGRGEPVAGVRTGAKTDDLDPFYRTSRARVETPAEWSVRRAALSDPNAIGDDREMAKLGAFKRRGTERPPKDSLSVAEGTAIVGPEWGSGEPEDWKTVRKGKGQFEHNDPFRQSAEMDGVVEYKHARGATGTADAYTLVDPRAEERARQERAIADALEENVRENAAAAARYKEAVDSNNGILSNYLYEVTGVNAAEQPLPQRGRTPQKPGPPESWHASLY